MVVGSSDGRKATHGSGSGTGASSPGSTQPGPSSSVTATAPTSASARVAVPAVQPAHQRRSAVVTGPKRAR